MATTNRSCKELLADNEDLRLRLEEAEETLRAIGSGEVDAFVVSGPDGPQVFTLKGSEQPYRVLVETMNEGALTVGIDMTILYCNQRFCDMVKSPMQDTIGQKFTNFFAPAQQQPLRTLLGNAYSGPVRQHLTLKASDGTDVSVQFAASLLMAGSQSSICMVASDLTELEEQASSIRVLREQQQALEENRAELLSEVAERKRAEDALKKLNEELENRITERTAELREKDQILQMQSRQAAMGEMIGNIAHQWRQPLNVLGLTIQQMLLFYDLGEFNREFLEKNVLQSMELIRHMSKTIDDFRNYFRPDKEKVAFKVNEVIANTLFLIAESFKNQKIEIEVFAREDPVIFGYQNEFAQVLLNILNNARDILTERGIGNPRVTITLCGEGDRAVVTVADNGGGVPEEIMERIFDPYFTTRGPQRGTGVGLYMSKSIIEKNMGGRLTVRNSADGAEFRIEV